MCNILHLQNVYVGNHGIIFNENGEMYDKKDQLTANSHIRFFLGYEKSGQLNLEQDTEVAKNLIKNKMYIEANDSPYIHLFHYFNIYVWGHLWDSLNILEDFEQINNNFKLATSRLTSHVSDLALHFELCGYTKNKILSCPWDGKKMFKFRDLYVSTKYVHPVTIRNKKWLQDKYIFQNKYISDTVEAIKSKEYKLYLSRNNYGKNRRLVNEEKVWGILKDKGYLKLDGSEGLISHIKYFAGAKKIICTHGSMLKNIAFCLNPTEVWEFFPLQRMAGSYPQYGSANIFQYMGRQLGIEYYFLPVESDTNQNINLDLELLKKIS